VSKPRLYVEGASRELDDLAKTYASLENASAFDAPAGGEPERPITDPLGVDEPARPAPKDFVQAGAKTTDRLLKFLLNLQREDQLPPEAIVFVAELFWMNVMNAPSLELAEARLRQARQQAGAYYERERVRLLATERP